MDEKTEPQFAENYEKKLAGRFSLLGDSKSDTSVYLVANHGYTIFEARITGYPLIWHGYDFGSIPYIGWGSTVQEALVDVLRGMRAVMTRTAEPVKLPERKENEVPGSMPEVPEQLPEGQSPETSE